MRRRAIVLLIAAACALGGAGLSWLGLEHGWWRLNHPNPARFPVRGVDVSHHQGLIDWPAVAGEPGLAFAFIKATEGGDWTDPRFQSNWRDARKAGLRVGAYHFFTFCRSPLDQAANFLAVVPREPDALPPVLDLEFGGNCRLDVEPDEVRRDVTLWLDAVEKGMGKRPLLYATSDAYETFLAGTPLDGPMWIRDVLTEPSRPAGWAFWQFDCRARVRGIDAEVDLNVFQGDRAALQRL